MTTKLQTALELREWQKKFNPANPMQPVNVLVKKPKNEQNGRYLTTSFFAK